MAVSGFLQENRVSVISAVLAVIFIILTPIVSIIGGLQQFLRSQLEMLQLGRWRQVAR